MKNIMLFLIVAIWFVCSCSSEVEKTERKRERPGPTAEQIAALNDELLNADGKLDAIAAKYGVSRDTVLKIMMGYSGMDAARPTMIFSSLLTHKKEGSAQVITASLAKQYGLPYSTVGGMIFDMKVLELAGQSDTDE